MLKELISTKTLDSLPEEGRVWRLLYANELPVSEWTVWSSESREDIETKARRQAKLDLKPGSGVYDNVFIIQRWDGQSWDDYDLDGEDLTELVFDEEDDDG